LALIVLFVGAFLVTDARPLEAENKRLESLVLKQQLESWKSKALNPLLGGSQSINESLKASQTLGIHLATIKRALQFDNIGNPGRSGMRTWIQFGDPILQEIFGELRVKHGKPEAAILHYFRGAIYAPIPNKNEPLARRDALSLKAAEALLALSLDQEAAFILQQFTNSKTPAGVIARKMLGMK
jgi:hypothetical protein